MWIPNISSGRKSTDVLFCRVITVGCLQLWEVVTTGEECTHPPLTAVRSTGDKNDPNLSTLGQVISDSKDPLSPLKLG